MGVKRGNALAIGALSLWTGLSGCGQLGVPDLQTGAVRGTVSNVSASVGYAYVLGAPQLKGGIAADGSYRIDHVPVGSVDVVVVAAAGGAMRAEVATVTVASETATRLDRDASAMALAGRIVVAVKPAGGSLGDGARFTVTGTVHQNVAGPGAVLPGLPAGSWTLSTTMPGFHSRSGAVDVAAGTDLFVDQTVDVDDADQRRGCLSSGCGNGLHCNASDGWCYACLADSDCGAGSHCDTGGSRTCVADAGAGGAASPSGSLTPASIRRSGGGRGARPR
jgi:hypothetical protein